MVSLFGDRGSSYGKLIFAFFLLHSALRWSLHAIETNVTDQGTSPVLPAYPLLTRALPDGECSANEECVKVACCNKITGVCGYGSDFCSKDVCSSQCDAKSECGPGAANPAVPCPLNVCCSPYGFCGTTEDYCGPDYEQPGPTNQSPSNVQDLVIGYFEAWSLLRRGCAGRTIDSIRIDSVTHINVAFGYMEPDTFKVYNIPGSSMENIKQITALKQRAPGLKVWVALGGWTYSDNDTDTQPVWSAIAASPQSRAKFIGELVSFMTQWGFDGVDLDWEYPAAPDRRGKPEDVVNYVDLLKDIRDYWTSQGRGWGLSFTAPTSYYYLRWFDIQNLVKYADWMNFMTYDIHGSWDNQSTEIGPHIFAHTNLTEIDTGMNLLWRNNIPANKVNLGLGFYGRSYTLADPSCGTPGCPFSDPGVAGTCSHDIAYQLTRGGDAHKDDVAGVMYYQYNTNQWISYDNAETIRAKVDYANKLGLRGLFIWAIDQDTLNNDLLNATLQPEGLGKFATKNGVGNDGQDWTPGSTAGCDWSDCGGKCLGKVSVATVRCPDTPDGSKPSKQLCCPPDNAPDPKFCHWRPDLSIFGTCTTNPHCNAGEELMATDKHWVDDKGNDQPCLFNIGSAAYCCEIEETTEAVCKWAEDLCWPDPPGDCPGDSVAIHYRRGDKCDQDHPWQPFCCTPGTDPDACYWAAGTTDPKNDPCRGFCKTGWDDLGLWFDGDGKTCFMDVGDLGNSDIPNRLCCDPDALKITRHLKTLPVPLNYLFDEVIPDSDDQDWAIRTDPNSVSDDPNKTSFGWHIMSGPEEQLTSVNKRDGTHWEVYGCDPTLHEGLQTARMVCTHSRDDHESDLESNCGKIFQGGVAGTVLEMPDGCGPGKYAMAVSLDPLPDVELVGEVAKGAELYHRLVKRNLTALTDRTVYQLTFDFDFSILQGRDDNKVKLRTDYSDDPGYWETVVAAPVKARGINLSRRQMHEEVHAEHGGSWAAYAEHHWQMDKRSTPPEKREELEARWLSLIIQDWIDRQGKVTYGANLITHAVRKNFKWTIFDQTKSCPTLDAFVRLYALFWINIDTSATLTLIFDLSNMGDPRESHIMVRNKGEIKTALVFEALADFRFSTGQTQIAGFAPVGASFSIPGIVTVGPEFKLIAELSARVILHADARIDLDVASWDYTQRYPFEDSFLDNGSKRQGSDNVTHVSAEGLGTPEFSYDIGAEGSVTAHVIPTMTFGITFNPKYTIPNAAIDFGVDAWAQIYGSAGSSTAVAWEYCYGAKMGYEVFARLDAPNIFKALGIDLSNRWTIYKPDDIDIIPEHCEQAKSVATRDILMGHQLQSTSPFQSF